MKLSPNVINQLCLRAGVHPTFSHLAGAAINDVVPLRFGVSVHGVVEAGDKLSGKERPVLFRQGQHFGHFLRSNAHAAVISVTAGILANTLRLAKAGIVSI